MTVLHPLTLAYQCRVAIVFWGPLNAAQLVEKLAARHINVTPEEVTTAMTFWLNQQPEYLRPLHLAEGFDVPTYK